MPEIQKSKQYDLEDRTLKFAIKVRDFARKVPPDIANAEDVRQLIRASGSVGANYIEANESLSKKDFLMRTKICRKESKESRYWLQLLYIANAALDTERHELMTEATELTNIFGSIVRKSE